MGEFVVSSFRLCPIPRRDARSYKAICLLQSIPGQVVRALYNRTAGTRFRPLAEHLLGFVREPHMLSVVQFGGRHYLLCQHQYVGPLMGVKAVSPLSDGSLICTYRYYDGGSDEYKEFSLKLNEFFASDFSYC